ncbi:MAG: cell division protein FtsL [Magnetococcales bacterium]|nr:cell division protein FtsL [Magnetococcales bacterium]
MKHEWLLSIALAVMLVMSASALVASRVWILETHRDMEKTEQERQRLLDEEHALQVEWVSRTDLNTMERRARDLGMQPPEKNQWHPAPDLNDTDVTEEP